MGMHETSCHEERDGWLTLRCSEPGLRALIAFDALAGRVAEL